MIKTLIWSVVLYGAEIWTMRKEDIKRLEAFEMWTWRRMEKVSWTEHKTNEDKTKEVDRTHSKRRITVKNGNRGENARKKIKRKTKTNDAGLDDGGRI